MSAARASPVCFLVVALFCLPLPPPQQRELKLDGRRVSVDIVVFSRDTLGKQWLGMDTVIVLWTANTERFTGPVFCVHTHQPHM